MSGPIRQKIGPTSKLLKDRIAGLKNYAIPPLNPEDLDTDIDTFEDLVEDIDADIKRIFDWTTSLENFDQQWQALIAAEDGDEEAKTYTTFVSKNNYAELMVEGQSKVTELENKRQKLVRALNKLRKEAGQTPLESLSPTSERTQDFRTPTGHSGSRRPQPMVAPTSQLPKLGLRTFNGDYRKWQPWSGWFRVTILNTEIPVLQQFMYLVSCMEANSPAEAAIAPFEMTESNFQLAWKALESNCGDTKKIIRSHWRTIHTIPAYNTNNTSNSELRQNLDSITLAINQLAQAGEDVESRSVQSLIQPKWPPRILEKLLDAESSNEKWNTSAMLEALDDILKRQEEVRSLCYGDEISKKSAKSPKLSSANKISNSNMTSENVSSAMFVGENSKNQKKDKHKEKKKTFNKESRGPYCIFHECEGHWSNECKGYAKDEDKLKKLKELKRCTNCTSKRHQSCDKTNTCALCKQPHHHVFHKETSGSSTYKTKVSKAKINTAITGDEESYTGTFSIHTTTGINGKRQKILYLVESEAINPTNMKSLKVLIVLDSGAEQSFISADVVKTLSLHGPKKDIYLSTFGNEKTFKTPSLAVKVYFKIFDGSLLNLEMQTISFMMRPIYTVLANDVVELDAKFLELKLHQPNVLIGIDHYNEVILTLRQKLPSHFWKQSTLFGPVVGGKGLTIGHLPNSEATENSLGIFMLSEPHQDKEMPIEPRLSSLIKSQYELNKLGIHDSSDRNADDEEATKILKENIRIDEDGRIEVPLLWKKNTTSVPTNKALAYGRFTSEFRKLHRTPEILDQYDKSIKDYVKNGISEIVDLKKLDGQFESYLPHHAVVKEASNTTKVRKVNDASASIGNGPSINDKLYTGPSKIPDAAGFLLRFRWFPLVILMDIEKAFLQLSIRKRDRDVLRYFWVKDVRRPVSSGNLMVQRYRRLPFGLICSPAILDAAIEFLMDSEGSEISNLIKENIYVDNICLGSRKTEELLKFYQESKRIFASVKMNVREFISNDTDVNQRIAEKDRMQVTANTIKVLGINWNCKEDKITLQLKPPEKIPVTKRNVLKLIAKCYDPLGLMSPVLLKAKIFCQGMWIKNYNWDDVGTLEEAEEWKTITSDWSNFEKSIERRLSGSETATYQLHAFCDGSTKAYATAVILRIEETDGRCESMLIFAKNHLKPLKGLTIPQMELMAVVIGCRALKFAEEQLRQQVQRRVVWTDSSAVIGWISTTKKQKVFVENRLKEIRKNSNFEFRHVDTENNTADCATRGLKAEEFIGFKLWWNGPLWLTQSDTYWPQNFIGEPPEVPESHKDDIEPETNSIGMNQLEIQDDFPINIQEFNKLSKLKRIVVYMLRWRKIVKFQKHSSECTPAIDHNDYNEAMAVLLKHAQRLHPPTEAQIKQLDLQLDKLGVLRSIGRLANSDLPETAKKPVFLPKKAKLTELVVMAEHVQHCHIKATSTLMYVRQNYWIPQGKRTVMTILNKNCLQCRRYDAQPFQHPKMPHLPVERVVKTKVFENCGVDFYGPIHIKIRSDKVKVWGVIFSCMVSRMTALEVATDCSAHTFIQVLQRFISNHGKPKIMVSDNATNFKLTEKVVFMAWQEVERHPDVVSYCAENGIEWQYVTTNASWRAGFYEAIIKLSKNCLRRCIGRALLDYNAFITLLAQTQAILNSRPLTYVSDTLEDNRVIRPIDFVSYGIEIGWPTLADEKMENGKTYFPPTLESREKLLEAIKKEEFYINKLWKDFYDFYLKVLREKHQMLHRQPRSAVPRAPKVGEVVILYDEMAPRAEWRLAKIEKLKPSPDGEVRSVTVRTPNGRHLDRPVNHCYPLEINDITPTPEETEKLEETPTCQPTVQRNLRPRANGVFKKPTNIFFIMICFFLMPNFELRATAGMITNGNEFTVETDLKPISIHCESHGIEVKLAPGIRHLEVCVNPYCFRRSGPSTYEYFELPTELLMYKQPIKARYWIGTREYMKKQECPAKEFCTINNCIWCWRFLLYLLQCIPLWVEIVMLLLLMMFLSIFYTIFDTVKKAFKSLAVIGNLLCFIFGPCLGPVIKSFWNLFAWVAKNKLNCRNKIMRTMSPGRTNIDSKSRNMNTKRAKEIPLLPTTNMEANCPRRRRDWRVPFPIWRRNVILSIFVTILLKPSFARECSEVVPLTVSENLCTRNELNVTRCEISQSTIVTIPPNQQTACLLLRDHRKNPLGTLKLRFGNIHYDCKSIIHHFTRRIQLNDISSKLCPREGSCTGDWCARVKPHETAPEFNGLPNQRPGYTYCNTGCSSWILCGCSIPSAACIPYRIFATEIEGEDTIYTIFSCHYEEEVTIQAELQKNFEHDQENNRTKPAETAYFDYHLEPGVPIEKNGIKITLFTQILPPEYIKRFFVTNGTHTAILNEETFEESKLFVCNSIENAKKMQCTFPAEASRCNIAEGKANCVHKKFSLDKILEKNHLPMMTPRIIFKKHNRSPWPILEFTQQTSIAVIVNFLNVEMDSLIDLVQAQIEFIELRGCAFCEAGAEMKLLCWTNIETVVHIECESIHFAILCKESKEIRSVQVAVKKTHFNESCQARWAGGEYTFQAVAELYIVDVNHWKSLDLEADPHASSIRRFGHSYAILYNWIFTTWYLPYVVVGALTLLILVSICTLCPCCLWCLIHARPHQD